jgi:cell division protein FtsZ
MMGTGEASGDRRAVEAAEAAISNPLLDDVSMKGASGLLVSITGGSDLTLYEVDEAASRIRAEADEDANIIVGATYDDELDGIIRVSVVATGIGLPSSAAQAPTASASAPQPERNRLTERLAGLATLPSAGPEEPPVDLDESLVVAPANDATPEPAVWRAPGNVTIEKRPAQATGIALPRTPAQAKPAAPQRNFQPAPPAAIKRPVRRMPSVEELPMVAQKAIRAQAGGEPATVGLAAQKRKVGFLERLANVGRGRKDEDAEMPSKVEPEFGQRRMSPETPRVETAAPRNVRIDRPREAVAAQAPARVEAQPRLANAGMQAGPGESLADDDLEIPAFLRRRAN